VTVVSLLFFCADSRAINRVRATMAKSVFFLFVLLSIYSAVQVKNIQNIRSEKCF
jgi:hypothetical protein